MKKSVIIKDTPNENKPRLPSAYQKSSILKRDPIPTISLEKIEESSDEDFEEDEIQKQTAPTEQHARRPTTRESFTRLESTLVEPADSIEFEVPVAARPSTRPTAESAFVAKQAASVTHRNAPGKGDAPSGVLKGKDGKGSQKKKKGKGKEKETIKLLGEKKKKKKKVDTRATYDIERGKSITPDAELANAIGGKGHKKSGKGIIWITREMAEAIGREYLLLATLKETIYFVIFAFISSIVCLGMSDSSMFHMFKVLEDQMLNVNDFQEVKTASKFWKFLEQMFSNSFYWDYWYYPDEYVAPANKYDKNIFYENKLLGVPRLRQLKVRDDSCPIHNYFKRIFVSCYGRYSMHNEDSASFGPKKGTAWKYHSHEEVGSVSYWGHIDWYHGGGFYQDLSLNRRETMRTIEDLKKHLWITRGTRVVFLEFAVYNTNVNLFSLVRAAFEFPPTGGVLTSSKIHVVKLLRYAVMYDYFILGCELILIVYYIYYQLEEIREIVYFKWGYLKKFWSYLDMAVLLLGYCAIVLGIVRTILVQKQLKYLIDHPNIYFNLDTLVMVQMYFRNLLAIQLFFIYLKIFKYLNFNKNMAQLNNTLSKCRKDMLGFGLMFLVIFIAFAVLGYLLFGTEVEDFSTFYLAMFTLLRTILGDFDYTDIEKANRVLAPIFFICFIFLVFFVLLNMFLAIINDTYTDVKTEIALAPEELQMTGFLKRGYYNLLIKMGCGKYVKPEEFQKNEYELTAGEIKAALKRIGFSDLEVEMFFARYNIDPDSEVTDYDVEALLAALEGRIDPTPPKDEPKVQEEPEKPLVAIDDFLKQQARLDEIEISINEATNALTTLLARLEHLENVRKIKLNQ